MWIKDFNIYDQHSAEEYLLSLGFDKFDMEDFKGFLIGDSPSEVEYWQKESQEWEHDSTMQFEKRNGLINDLQEVADDLDAGKGTKKKIADRIRHLCEEWY